MKNTNVIFSLFIGQILCFFFLQTVFCQTETLGIVQYKPPKGWTKTAKVENVVAFSEINQKTGKFCIITLHGATPDTGNPAGDFTREWKNLVVKNMKAEANPKTDEQQSDGWTVMSGGSGADSAEMGKAIAFLTVISGFDQTVSVLAVFNDPAYEKQVDSFISGIDLDKPAPPVKNPAATTRSASASGAVAFDDAGNLIIPQPSRQLTTADLAGVWIDGPNRMTTEYVYSGSGKSAGRDTTAFEVKTTFRSDGTYSSFFNSVRKKYEQESGTTTGPYSIVGRLLSMQGTGNSGKTIVMTKYVIRGWLELPDRTILQLAGPWYDNAEIPERNFTDFGEESRFLATTKWVRIK